MSPEPPRRQEPAAIVRSPESIYASTVGEATSVELIQELISRTSGERAAVSTGDLIPKNESAARDLSLAITHLEDARTRINAAHYKVSGKFSISDAER